MELNTRSDQAANSDALENQSPTMEEPKLDNESSHCVDGNKEISQDSEAVSKKVDSNLGPIKSDTPTVNVLNGDYCGLFTQASIDYVDIFEILREEILAAEARELEVNGLLNADEEEEKESPQTKGLESTHLGDPKVTDLDRDGCQGEAQNCSYNDKVTDVADAALTSQKTEASEATDIADRSLTPQKIEDGEAADVANTAFISQKSKKVEATDVADTALISQKSEDREAEIPHSASAGLVEDVVLKEVEKMSTEDKAVLLEDNKAGFEGRLELADVRDTGLGQDNRLAEEGEDGEFSIMTPRQGAFAQAFPKDDDADREETLPPPSNVHMNGDDFSKKDEGAVVDRGKEALVGNSKGDDDGDSLLQNDNMSDKLSERSEDDDYTSTPFSGPIAFSGMLAYSGLIPYSGQIPHSGNMSLHSDSSTSTRSFAFPILAADWNSSPAKIGQPDSRYIRRRRRWRPRFCCERPATLFD